MKRRTFIGGLVGSAATAALPVRVCAAAPAVAAWEALRRRVGNRLIPIHSPLVAAARSAGAGAGELFKQLKNPYYLGDDPSLTQTLGWTDAWTSEPSLMAVAAESAADVAAAVDVAREYKLKLVVKGGGHSYFGNSNAANSLLVWTRRMDQVELHDTFLPQGGPISHGGDSGVSIGAGAIWGRVYDTVAVKNRQYVQGGGCLTVGVAGFVQGGGFGSLSKQFGTGAANLLEAEVVTADGRVRIANPFHNPDLFFALRGGGGGTFGIVTRLTLKTHPIPSWMGAFLFDVTAADDASWGALVERVIGFYAERLFNPSWGEQLRFFPGRKLQILMVCHSLTKPQIEETWAPFVSWVKERPKSYSIDNGPLALALPNGQFWNPAALKQVPGLVLPDNRPGAPAGNIFWAGNLGEAGQILNAYQSAWLPQSLLAPTRRPALVEAIVSGSRHWGFELHTNKGLAGGSSWALDSTRRTAMNPEVLDAFALLISASNSDPAYPGIPGHEPDIAGGRERAALVSRAMAPIRQLVPNAGAYVSEADYFQKDWKHAYWGDHYPRLAQIKRKYDPHNLFRGHQTVGPA